jgi:hypothetical protein
MPGSMPGVPLVSPIAPPLTLSVQSDQKLF